MPRGLTGTGAGVSVFVGEFRGNEMRPLSITLVCFGLLAFPALLEAKPQRHIVRIEGLRFRPAEIEIRPGDTVVWENYDERDHTVRADDGSFRSRRMGTGSTFEHTFNKPGRYPYHDDLYGRMTAVVIVRARE